MQSLRIFRILMNDMRTSTKPFIAALAASLLFVGAGCSLLGGGSNLLIRDEGVPGLVVALAAAAFGSIHVAGRRARSRRARIPYC